MKRVKIFKDGNEKTAEIDTDKMNSCKVDGKVFKVEDKSRYDNLFRLQEKLEGYKFKTCINCKFFHFHPKIGGKRFCTPRWLLFSKIYEGSGISINSSIIKNLKIKMLLGESLKSYMDVLDSCDRFEYMDREEKLKSMDWPKHREESKKVIQNEEDWYWPEQKKKYDEELKSAEKAIEEELKSAKKQDLPPLIKKYFDYREKNTDYYDLREKVIIHRFGKEHLLDRDMDITPNLTDLVTKHICPACSDLDRKEIVMETVGENLICPECNFSVEVKWVKKAKKSWEEFAEVEKEIERKNILVTKEQIMFYRKKYNPLKIPEYLLLVSFHLKKRFISAEGITEEQLIDKLKTLFKERMSIGDITVKKIEEDKSKTRLSIKKMDLLVDISESGNHLLSIEVKGKTKEWSKADTDEKIRFNKLLENLKKDFEIENLTFYNQSGYFGLGNLNLEYPDGFRIRRNR